MINEGEPNYEETNGTDNIGNGDVRGVPDMEESSVEEINDAIVDFGHGTTSGESGKVEEIDFHKRPRQHRRVTDNHDLILAELKNGKMLSDIADECGCERHSLSKYIHSNPDLEAAFRDAQEKRLDLMEKVVLNVATVDAANTITETGAFSQWDGRVLTANLHAAKFWLERQGAKRGWNAKLETNEVGNGGMRVPMIFLGDVSEEAIANAEAQIKAANKDAGVGE